MNNFTKLKDVLSMVLKINHNLITDESSPENIPSWDSFNGIILVTELEKEFQVKFSLEEVMAVKNVKDIKDSLRRHGVEI